MPDNTTLNTGLHHIALRARDFDRSLRFYTETIGCTPAVQWGEAPQRAVLLDIGDGSHVEIFEHPDQPAPSDDPPPALLHFAFRTPDCDAALERARAAGCEITMEPKQVDIPNTAAASPSPMPVRIAFCKGPDGEIVEFFQPLA